ncbi:MAG: CPBP family intramembrane glutamic endopeptidase [Chloroflexota bacterium]
MSERTSRTPWGFGHIITILGLSLAGWVAGGVLLVGVMLRAQQRTLSVSTGLALTAIVYLILYLAIVVVIRSSGGWSVLGYRFPGWKTLLGVLTFLPVWFGILLLAGIASAYVINHGQPIPSNVTELFGPGGLRGIGPGTIALAFVVVAGVAPLVEEALFRGVLYQWLRGRLGVAPAVVVDALIFASAHLVSGVAGLWKLLPVLFVMGCILALVFQRTRSLFASMLLHGANNGLAIIALLVAMRH